MRPKKAWARASRLSWGSRVPQAHQASGCWSIAASLVIRAPPRKGSFSGLRRRLAGFGALAVHDPQGGFWMFLAGFRVGRGFGALFSSNGGVGLRHQHSAAIARPFFSLQPQEITRPVAPRSAKRGGFSESLGTAGHDSNLAP